MAARVKKRTDTGTNRESDKIIIRLPAGMRDRLHEIAEHNGRSMTAEVVEALQDWISREDREASLADTVDRIERLVFENNRMVAEQVRLLQQQSRLPIPKVPKAAEAKAFADFQEAVDATAKALQKRKAKTPQT